MRSVSVRACGVALLLLLVFFWAVPTFADGSLGTVVLEGRIHVVPGLPAEQEDATEQGRIAPPVGGASEESQQGRIHTPPGLPDEEPPSVWQLFLVWVQGRILVPVG